MEEAQRKIEEQTGRISLLEQREREWDAQRARLIDKRATEQREEETETLRTKLQFSQRDSDQLKEQVQMHFFYK